MAIKEQDKVFYEVADNGDKVINLPVTRANNVEGLGRSINTYYSVGNVVYVDSNLSVALKCTQAGTTSNTELDISNKVVGESVADGSVVWEVVKRDLSEEVKANADNFANYLSLSGGTMSGAINFSNDGSIVESEDSMEVRANSVDGGRLTLRKKNFTANPGGFQLRASNDGSNKYLMGNANGRLTWNGNSVITTQEIQQGKGIDYVVTAGQTRDIKITYPKALKSTVYPKCWLASNGNYHYYAVTLHTLNPTTTGFTLRIESGVSSISDYYVDFYWEVIGEVAV